MLIHLEKLKCPYCGSEDVSENSHEEMHCDSLYLPPRIYWRWECLECEKEFNMIIYITDYEMEKIES
jgi:transposase-like protein